MHKIKSTTAHTLMFHVDDPGHMIDHHFDAGFDVDTLDHYVLNGGFMYSI